MRLAVHRLGQMSEAADDDDAAHLHRVVAPFTGVFYRSPTPSARAYVSEGDWVEADAVIGLVETMKIFNEVTADLFGSHRRIRGRKRPTGPRRRRAGAGRARRAGNRRVGAPPVSQPYVRIAGWGKYLPERVMPNAEIAELVDTSDEWIQARTGIRERRIAAPDETTCTLAVNAAQAALDRAQVRAEDLDLIIVATCTPDYANMPATASLVQHALGASKAGAFDLNAVCSGFLYALATGSQFILTGAHQSVLVIGADVFTRMLDWQDRSTCVLFGDGAGAVVLQADGQRRVDCCRSCWAATARARAACTCPRVAAGGQPRPRRWPSAGITSRCRAARCSASPRGSCRSRSSRRSRQPT